MPEELRGTSSPTNVVDTQEEVDKWKEEHPEWEAMGMGRPCLLYTSPSPRD